MVYSFLEIDNDNNFDTSSYIEAQNNTTSNPGVIVEYSDIGIHTITGPVPLVDISDTTSRNGAGHADSKTIKIDLTGKIVATGVDAVVGKISDLRKLFQETKEDFGIFKIKCGTTEVFAATGVRVLDMSFNKTQDNWTQTADYNISLEYQEALKDNGTFYNVTSTSDSWSVEPIEDYFYTYMQHSTSGRRENHNPQIKPAVAGGTNLGSSGGTNNITIYSIPQYRVTHRVSAVGFSNLHSSHKASSPAYLSAKKWVSDRLSLVFSTQQARPTGVGYFGDTATLQTLIDNSINLYNHARTTSFSVSDGSYEVNDTWLAMPFQTKYTEDYSIDVSTDERHIKTVRVQGQIRGLSMSSIPFMTGAPIPSGSGQINLEGHYNHSGSLGSVMIPDASGQNTTKNQLTTNKYQNAEDGWLYDIKPYLYKRASMVMNSSDRNRTYINTTITTSTPATPNNPVYCYENLLNPIPVSTTEGHDPRKGTISYSYEYNNKNVFITGVIAENISISDTGPTDVYSENFVIGRALGPVIQSLGTKTSSRKDVTIELVVLPPSSLKGHFMTESECPLYTGGYIFGKVKSIIDGLAPFGARDASLFSNPRTAQPGIVQKTQNNHNWNPSEGRYTRTVSWIYQQCNATSDWMHH